MAEQTATTRVAWYSRMELPEKHNLPSGFEFCRALDAPGIDNAFDLAVMDSQAFPDLDQLRHIYLSLGMPALLIVDTVEQETSALAWLAPEDEVCRREVLAQQLTLRLSRRQRRDEPPTTIEKGQSPGVANRREFEAYANAQIAANEAGDPQCLVWLDLDSFKIINHELGHAAGDQILQEVAQILVRCAAGAGFVARFGGDEFVILMQCSLEQGAAFAEFLKEQITLHEFRIGARTVHVTASFGVASSLSHLSADTLLASADRCLYAAKQQGRNCIVTDEAFGVLADAAGKDAMIADFENRLRVYAARMIGSLVLKARRLSDQYRSEADHDGLTGIFNRRYLDRLLPREIEKSRSGNRRLSIAMLDLDHFGEINRTYGFPTGDRALRAASEALQRGVRAGDWIARYGGEEFCIVMPDTSLDFASQIAERIRLSLGEAVISAYDGRQFRISASIGIIELQPGDADAVALYQRAGNKVREAKLGGRNQIRF